MDALVHAEALATLGSAWLPRLADLAVKGTALLLVAATVAALLKRSSAAARHLVWSAALAGVVVLLVAAPLVPAWEVPLLPSVALTVGRGDVVNLTSPARPGTRREPTLERETPGRAPLSSAARGAPGSASLAPVAPRAVTRVTPTVGPGARATILADAAADVASWSTPSDVGSQFGSVAPAAWSISLPGLLVAVWVTGALLVLARLTVGTLGVARLARQAEPVEDPAWTLLAQRLARRLGIRRPITLLVSARRTVPVTWGVLYPVVLLPADALNWGVERRRLVLLHELAHVGRLDALTYVVTQLAAAAFWFNPLVWIAARRARAEAERACDDVVLVSGERASRYADDLLEIVRTLDHAAAPAFAALAMARPTEIEGRLLAILDPAVRRGRPGRGGTLAAVGGALVLALPLAALHARPLAAEAADPLGGGMLRTFGPASDAAGGGVTPSASSGSATRDSAAAVAPPPAVVPMVSAEPPATPSESSSRWSAEGSPCEIRGSTGVRGTQIHVTDDTRGKEAATTSYTVIDDDHCLSIKSEGVIEFTDDERDVLRMGPGAYFAAVESRPGVTRRIEITPAPDGTPRRAYWVNGEPADARDAAAWLGELLPELVRELAANPGPRVARIRQRRGVAGVLEEIRRTKSDHAKRVYFEALLEQGGLTPDTLRQAARLAGRAIASDGDKAAVLTAIAAAAPNERSVWSEVVAASQTIASDGDKRRVLETLLDGGASNGALAQLAEAAQGIASDGDKAAVLMHMSPRFQRDPALRQAFFGAVRTIASDGDRRRVLLNVLDSDSLDAAALTSLLAAAREIASDGDKSAVLGAVARRYALGDVSVRRAFFDAANTIASDHDRSTVLRTLLERGATDSATMLDLLSSTSGIASDHDKSTVLLDVARRSEMRDAAVRKRFFEVLKTVSSSSDYRRVMEVVAEQ